MVSQMLIHEIRDYALARCGSLRPSDVRIGLGYTAVLLDNGRCGLAYTLHEQEFESCCVVPEAGKLVGRSAAELIPWTDSRDVISCAVGLATANAVVAPPDDSVEGDVASLLPVHQDDTVGMVGYFGPLVPIFRERARELHIFERKPNPDYGILPDSEAVNLLPGCQVAILTATALLNHTIDDLLGLCGNAREIAILGPTTPFVPEVFTRRGVTLLSGLEVVDSGKILQIVSQGGGTRQFGRAVRKLSLRLSA
jgi:uncharacterized protein (DUF4213/DUF364 family)